MTPSPINWRRKFLIFIIAVVVFTITGPFGTYAELSWPWRFAYWSLILPACGVIIHLGVDYVIRLPALRETPRLIRLLAGASLSSVPATGIAFVVEEAFRPEYEGIYSWLGFWLSVAIVSVVIGYMNFMPPFVKLQPVADFGEIDLESVAFLKRLPEGLGTELVSLSMQDHYVEVETTQGRELILMKFADALSELSGYPGVRIHRSHWVSAAGLKKFRINGRTVTVVTSSGRELPVSKPYRKETERFAGNLQQATELA